MVMEITELTDMENIKHTSILHMLTIIQIEKNDEINPSEIDEDENQSINRITSFIKNKYKLIINWLNK